MQTGKGDGCCWKSRSVNAHTFRSQQSQYKVEVNASAGRKYANAIVKSVRIPMSYDDAYPHHGLRFS